MAAQKYLIPEKYLLVSTCVAVPIRGGAGPGGGVLVREVPLAGLVQAAEGEECRVEFVEELSRQLQPGPLEGKGEARQPRPELEVVVEEGRVGVAEAPCPGLLEPDIDYLVAQLLLGPRVHLVVGLEHEALLLGDESPHPHLPVVLRRAALPVLAGDALVALVVVSIPLLLEPGSGTGKSIAHLLGGGGRPRLCS